MISNMANQEKGTPESRDRQQKEISEYIRKKQAQVETEAKSPDGTQAAVTIVSESSEK